MADVHTPQQRSYNMSRIRGKDTTCERLVRSFLFRNGYRFRINNPHLVGKPDIVLAKYRTVIFVHGCFWHGHNGCKFYVQPKTNAEFWLNKINRNRDRDLFVAGKLIEDGWNVITIWECELKASVRDTTLNSLLHEIRESQT